MRSIQPVPSLPSFTARRDRMLLKGARYGIALHCDGGVAFDRDMRRLVDQGLMRLERRSRGGRSNRSILVTTELGEKLLLARDITPDLERSTRTPWMRGAWEQPFGRGRGVLVGGERREVRHLRAFANADGPERGEDGEYVTSGATLVARSFSEGQRVFHWQSRDGGAFVTKGETLLPAGVLFRTGRGLVLKPHTCLQLPTQRRGVDQFEPELAANIASLREMASEPFDILLCGYHYIVTRCDADAVLARFLITGGKPFHGFGTEQPSDNEPWW